MRRPLDTIEEGAAVQREIHVEYVAN